jgi:hypothetical protein
MDELVQVFFYGGLMNPAVMQRVGLVERDVQLAALQDYRIEIRPWVTLRPSPRSTCFGILMPATHDELNAVYAKLAVQYHPYPVQVSTGQVVVPALTYLADPMEPRTADADHVLPLLEAATTLGFPGWYLDEISSFLPLR